MEEREIAMRTADEDKVERCFVIRPEGWGKACRWVHEDSIEERVVLGNDEDGEETFDCMRSFSDDEGFSVHALCKYTNEHEFTHGDYVYAWEVYMESDKEPDGLYYCESFSLEVRDDEAERYEIARIADQCVEWVAAMVEYETTGVCPHTCEPFHDEISYFVDGFLAEVFG